MKNASETLNISLRKDIGKELFDYIVENKTSCEIVINRALHKFLKMKKSTGLSEHLRWGIHSDEDICKTLFITQEIVRKAKKELERVSAMNLSDAQLKAHYAKIDKLAQF